MKALTEADHEQLQNSNRSLELLQRQYEFLVHGSPVDKAIKPATLGHGIQVLSAQATTDALHYFNQYKDTRSWMKFVPASGAASRMFAPFFNYQEEKNKPNFDFDAYLQSPSGILIRRLFEELKKLPFYPTAYKQIIENSSIPLTTDRHFFEVFIRLVLDENELAYPQLPKALIPFFNDKDGQQWNAFEAQLLEAAKLGDLHQAVPVHLTIDKAHRSRFEAQEKVFQSKLPSKQRREFKVEYSFQHPLTDTPYLDEEKEWGRDEVGKIDFRKGGHGALLENLNRLEADLIWIKNIDNILLNEANAEGEKWMKILGGYLLQIQNQIFDFLEVLQHPNSAPDRESICRFIRTHFDRDYRLAPQGKLPNSVLYDYLNRPLRICGMIPNAGAKGGGPFWKKDARGNTLQIIEGVELDPKNAAHQEALAQSTHFNPVLMVCGITNHKGEKFSLYDFRDEKRFMVSEKTRGATKIKILEWPGLWNGGMAAWNTLFIELPSATFHPVKTIADLVR